MTMWNKPPDPSLGEVEPIDKNLEKQKVENWRFKRLLKVCSESLGEDEIAALVQLAESGADLRAMETALERGCKLKDAVGIFV